MDGLVFLESLGRLPYTTDFLPTLQLYSNISHQLIQWYRLWLQQLAGIQFNKFCAVRQATKFMVMNPSWIQSGNSLIMFISLQNVSIVHFTNISVFDFQIDISRFFQHMA
jgi:hypothetical protein